MVAANPTFEKLVALACGGGEPAFCLAIPEAEDLELVADLVEESFERLLASKFASEESLGALAGLWNRWVSWSDRQLTLGALRVRLARFLRSPTLRRPALDVAEEWSVGVLLVPATGHEGAQPPAAYFELCLLPPDSGRPPARPQAGRLPKASVLEPYLQNLCVANAYRRRGVGRSMLAIAEAIAREGWGSKQMYLHTDDDPAAFGLYTVQGYAVRRWDASGEGVIMYMCKDIAPC